MLKSGGYAALLDRDVVTQCPLCDTDNPDLDNRGFCSNCGALFREKIRRRLLLVKVAALLGVLVTATGAALALAYEYRWIGLGVFAAGVLPLVFGMLANRQLAGFLFEALARRAATDTRRALRTTDRIAVFMLLFFLAAFAGCFPYYLYIERPRQALGDYQIRFKDAVAGYLELVPADALPPVKAQPFLEGKAVVIEKTSTGAALSEVHLALPPEVRAEAPAEVGTVVIVEWTDFAKGEYGEKGSGVLALRVDGNVRIVNYPNKTLLGEETFPGGDPPGEAPADGGPARGVRPIAKIAGYVAGLKRQTPSPSSPPEAPAAETEAAGNKTETP